MRACARRKATSRGAVRILEAILQVQPGDASARDCSEIEHRAAIVHTEPARTPRGRAAATTAELTRRFRDDSSAGPDASIERLVGVARAAAEEPGSARMLDDVLKGVLPTSRSAMRAPRRPGRHGGGVRRREGRSGPRRRSRPRSPICSGRSRQPTATPVSPRRRNSPRAGSRSGQCRAEGGDAAVPPGRVLDGIGSLGRTRFALRKAAAALRPELI